MNRWGAVGLALLMIAAGSACGDDTGALRQEVAALKATVNAPSPTATETPVPTETPIPPTATATATPVPTVAPTLPPKPQPPAPTATATVDRPLLQPGQAVNAVWAKYGGWKCLSAGDGFNTITQDWLGADYLGGHRWDVVSFQTSGGHRLFEVILNEQDGSMLLVNSPPACR
jgi:hypothetical protein